MTAGGICRVLLLCAMAFGPGAGGAQEATPDTATGAGAAPTETSRPRTTLPILVFDHARVLHESAMGQALEAKISARQAEVLVENDRIYAELEAEEQEIAAARETLSEEAFRARASEFDTRVTEARSAQDEKAAAVQTLYDEGVAEIEAAINKALADLAGEFSAVIVFERQQVYLMSGAIDVSDRLIDRLDASAAPVQPSASK